MGLISIDGYEPRHLSHSSIDGYRTCGMRFRLQKVLQKEQRPGLAALGGNAVHLATEWWDLYEAGGYDPETDTKDPAAMFRKAWDEEVARRREQSPNYKLEDYTLTGRAAAKYGGKRNVDWWMDNGPLMVQRWIDWREAQGWHMWETPDGLPAVEVELNITLPGDIPVKMFLDRIMILPSGQISVLDIKTGRLPETAEQLGLYATGIEFEYGQMFRPDWAYFWDAQKGEHVGPFDLGMYTPAYFAEVYGEAIRGINAGCFLAKPANNCKSWCSTAKYCPAVGGSLSA